MGCGPSVSYAATPSGTTDAPPPQPAGGAGATSTKSRFSLDSGARPEEAPDAGSPEASLRLLNLDSIRDEEVPCRQPTSTSPMHEFVPLAPMTSAPSKSQIRSPSSVSRHTVLSQGLSASAYDDDQRSLSQTEVIMADLHAVSASGSSRQLLELAHRLPRQWNNPGGVNNGETGSSCSLVDNDREECERLLDDEEC